MRKLKGKKKITPIVKEAIEKDKGKSLADDPPFETISSYYKICNESVTRKRKLNSTNTESESPEKSPKLMETTTSTINESLEIDEQPSISQPTMLTNDGNLRNLSESFIENSLAKICPNTRNLHHNNLNNNLNYKILFHALMLFHQKMNSYLEKPIYKHEQW